MRAKAHLRTVLGHPAVLDDHAQRTVYVVAFALLAELRDGAQLVPRQPARLEALQESLVVRRVRQRQPEPFDDKVVAQQHHAEGCGALLPNDRGALLPK